ncbi:hypothetical protein ACFQZC_11335 [Streptacidiphilus monticola]
MGELALPAGWLMPGELMARARTALSTGYWTRFLPILGALVAFTHLPSFARSVWSPDEGYLATQARMLAGGGVLYDTVVDRKPLCCPGSTRRPSGSSALPPCGPCGSWPSART